jgi:signal transduction histidine kinase
VPVIALAHLLARRRAALGSLDRQFGAGAALACGLVLIGFGAIALLMFVSASDAYLLAGVLIFAAALSCYCAALLGHGVKRDIQALRDHLRAVGDGRRPIEPVRTGGADELAELAAAANRMSEQLAEREAERDAAEGSRRDLIAAVSHDLRTPLASLQLLADAIEDGLSDSERTSERYMREISLQVRAMSTLVDDLFELTRLEAGQIGWSMRQVQLRDLVIETVEAMRPQAVAKRISVQTLLPAELPAARANPEGVQRVLFNLMANAIRYTPADGSVTVAAEPNGSALEVEVADSGDGIDASERRRVFEPFFRGRREASRTTDGAGLGLSICRAIVEIHGGRIWVEPSAAGACVRFSLPRAGDGHPKPEEASAQLRRDGLLSGFSPSA